MTKVPIKVIYNGTEGKLVFRENWTTRQVEAKVNKVVVLRNSEYRL